MTEIDDLLQLVIDNMPARVFWKDKNCVYLGGNRRFAQDAGLSHVEALAGKTDFDLAWSRSQSEAFIKDDKEVMSTGKPKLNIEEPQNQADGNIHWLETNKIPLFDSDGELVGILGTYRDITAEKNRKLAFEKMALMDALTELPNRHFVEQRLKNIQDERLDYFGLLFIDLDYFKTVNDTLGHDIGDSLLQKVAYELKRTLGNRGMIARLGGDEFCVLTTKFNKTTEAKEELEDLSKELLTVFRKPFLVEQHILYLGASIGITLCQGNEVNGSLLFREADLAMYEAKALGRNAYVFYSDKLKQSADEDNKLLMQLRRAVDQQEFHLVYQPQFDAEQQCVGAEALMRWSNSDKGAISPVQFIPMAEKAGLIHPIGDWLLDEVKRVQTHRRSRAKTQLIAINISPVQFVQDGFEQLLATKLLETGLPSSIFEIEVTESVFLSNQEDAFDKLRRLREQGFSIAIDDFGTGYSSLSYLSQLPIDKLKIDRTFITRLFDNEKNQVIVKMILQMAKNLDIKTIAEGVETLEEFEFLKEHGCDYFQGYYFSKPISENAFCDEY